MVGTIRKLRKAGAMFRDPPPTYYCIKDKMEQIRAVTHQPWEFKELGILIDTELDSLQQEGDRATMEDFILQIFTQPIFTQNTFFMEVIHRSGKSRGFGAGNIRALALSIILLEERRKEEEAVKKEITVTYY